MNKIGIFTGFFLPHLGGVERYTDKLVEQLSNLGYEIVIITTNDNNYKVFEESEGYKIYRLPTFNILKSRYPILKRNRLFNELLDKINKENIDYYICNTRFYFTSLLCSKLAKKNKKNFYVIEHGSSHFTVNNKILDFFGACYEHILTQKLKNSNPFFYGVSQRCSNWLKHFNITAKGVLYNSVDAKTYEQFKDKHFIKNKSNKIIIGYAGRIIKEKGIFLLLNAFVKLSEEYNNIELYIAGDGPKLDKIKEEYNYNNIHFLGKLNYENVMSLYNDIDIFVNPSMYPEGLPTTILEAGIMKCAIVATDRGGTIEVVENEKYGEIIQENVKSLEETLKKLLDNKKLIENKKNKIHDRIMKNFTWEKTAKRLVKELKNER